MKRRLEALAIGMLIALVAAPAAVAQYSSSKPQYARLDPYGPYQPIYHDWFQEPGGDPAGQEQEEAAEEPDAGPLTGVDSLKVDNGSEHPNLLRPRFSFTQRADANDDFSGVRGLSTLSGSVELFRRSAKTELSVEYAGGASIFNNGRDANRSYHQLRLKETFRGRRWSLLLGNESSYLPEAPFSFVGTGGLLITGTFTIDGIGHSFRNIILPIQTLITGRSNRTSTASVAQFQYRLNPRSSLFVAGVHGILRFADPKLIDSNQTQFITGYERSVGRGGTLGITYAHGRYQFSKGIEGIQNHVVQVSYGRRLSRRMALAVSGGPQVSQFRDLFTGDQTKVFWTVNSTLLYRLDRTHFGLGYSRDMTAGSGVLGGSQAHMVRVTMSRQLSRKWAMSLHSGYAHNTGLRVFTLTPTRQTYDSQFGGLRFHRTLGRDRHMTLGYSLSHQNFNTPDCVGSLCQSERLRHAFEISFEWLPRPFRLD